MPDPEVPPSTDFQGDGWRYIVSSFVVSPGETVVVDVWCKLRGQGGDEGFVMVKRVEVVDGIEPWWVSTSGPLDSQGRGVLRLWIPDDAPVDAPMRISIDCIEDGDQMFGTERFDFAIVSATSTTLPSTTVTSVTVGSRGVASTAVSATAPSDGSLATPIVGGATFAAVAVAIVAVRRRSRRGPIRPE